MSNNWGIFLGACFLLIILSEGMYFQTSLHQFGGLSYKRRYWPRLKLLYSTFVDLAGEFCNGIREYFGILEIVMKSHVMQ